jgi:hypothetical protein
MKTANSSCGTRHTWVMPWWVRLPQLSDVHAATESDEPQQFGLCSTGDGLYLGNSMPIRDMDMYADAVSASHRSLADGAAAPLPAHGFGTVAEAGEINS